MLDKANFTKTYGLYSVLPVSENRAMAELLTTNEEGEASSDVIFYGLGSLALELSVPLEELEEAFISDKVVKGYRIAEVGHVDTYGNTVRTDLPPTLLPFEINQDDLRYWVTDGEGDAVCCWEECVPNKLVFVSEQISAAHGHSLEEVYSSLGMATGFGSLGKFREFVYDSLSSVVYGRDGKLVMVLQNGYLLELRTHGNMLAKYMEKTNEEVKNPLGNYVCKTPEFTVELDMLVDTARHYIKQSGENSPPWLSSTEIMNSFIRLDQSGLLFGDGYTLLENNSEVLTAQAARMAINWFPNAVQEPLHHALTMAYMVHSTNQGVNDATKS